MLCLIKFSDIDATKVFKILGMPFSGERSACGNALAAKSLDIQHVLKMCMMEPRVHMYIFVVTLVPNRDGKFICGGISPIVSIYTPMMYFLG